MKRRIFVVAAVIIGSTLYAQEDSTGRLLDEVIMTSNKYPRKQSETGKVVTVISRDQLERSSGRSLSEVLNTVVGTTISGANNNFGTNLTASIRGGSAGNLLFLVDGIPINDPSVNTNYFDLNLFAIDQIERIEILKGGQSTLYGSDAVNGVINIITRKAGDGKFNIRGGLAGGSYSTFKQNVAVNGNTSGMNYSIGYTHQSMEGFSSAYDEAGTNDYDKDGSQQHVVNTRIGFDHNKRLRSFVFGTYSHYRADLDAAAFIDEKDYGVTNSNIQAGAGMAYDHAAGSLRFNYTFNYIERDYVDDSTYKSSPFVDWSRGHFMGRTHYAEVYNSWKRDNWELLTGLDFRLNGTSQSYVSGSSFGLFEPPALSAKMNQLSPYASFIYKGLENFNAEIGGRLNFHSEYGNNFSFTLNPSYLINRKIKIFANLYSAFKTPTLYQLFDYDAGNPDLDPERGIIGELGIELIPTNAFRLRAVGFYRNTKDAILFSYNPTIFDSEYINASSQKNYGIEVESVFKLDNWNISANYTYTDGETTAAYDGTGVGLGKDTTYYNLYRIPKHAFNMEVGYRFSKALYVSSQLRVVGDREEFIFGAPPETLDSYAVIDLYGEYSVSKSVKLFLDLKNITDKQYFDLLGYNSRRVNFMFGMNVSIN
jgi:vitamin B12 transporter